MVVVIEGVGDDVAFDIAPVLGQFLFGESLRAGRPFTGDGTFASTFADPVLDRLDLRIGPIVPESLSNPAVVRTVTVPVRPAVQRHDQRRIATARSLGITREGLYK